ncbi:alkaline phosphatase-like protein [Rhizodiscina lignyota]|uniref:Alkaline phosphatase-like protein n=1 Tax=Rhizodiscina lignyota TaxID=1504668 RepID=A0A9P4IMG5_9PEZI|nr:alkaline phosphatase-like protein [Rhizodiscina lignyota]
MFFALVGLLYAAVVYASYGNNLNYRSPSNHHASMGISIRKIVKRGDIEARVNPSDLKFTHGIASGDPYANSVILWTRIAPEEDDDKSNVTVSGFVPLYNHETESYVKASTAPICVNWKVGTEKSMADSCIVSKGTAYTTSDIDYTVKVEAGGLKPFSTYYYQFEVCNSNNKSPVGRTKTIPSKHDKAANVRLAIYSCSNYPFGFFNSYGNVARKDSVDYIVHLGDFIYEYQEGVYGWGWSIDRIPLPDKAIYSLYDYRKRYATYKTDLDLLEVSAAFPWIAVWDDHEVADNTWRDGEADLNNTEQSFVFDGGVSVDQRKMNAVRAYFEWMPIRQVDMDDNLRIWRTFSIGDLFDLIMLDTRHYDRSITDLYWNTEYIWDIHNDAGRSMMGSRQENWFYDQLTESNKRGAQWRLIGSQIVFSRMNESFSFGNEVPLNMDSWDGYMANKNRTFDHLYKNKIGNNILLSGDSHLSWVTDLVWSGEKPYDSETGEGAIGVEFGGTAITSPCPYGQNITIKQANNFSHILTSSNEELQWQETYYRGYYELDISYEEVKAEYFGTPTVITRNPYEISLANFTVKSGANKLQRPVAGGVAESGSLRYGKIKQTNITHDTSKNTYFISHEKLAEDL